MKTSSSLKQQVTFENESTKDVVLHWKKRTLCFTKYHNAL